MFIYVLSIKEAKKLIRASRASQPKAHDDSKCMHIEWNGMGLCLQLHKSLSATEKIIQQKQKTLFKKWC